MNSCAGGGDEGIGVNHGAGRGNKNNADPGCFSKSDAEEQIEFVRWWDETVSLNKGGDRGNQYTEPKTQIEVFGKSDAEDLTGISQQQVSRWRSGFRIVPVQQLAD